MPAWYCRMRRIAMGGDSPRLSALLALHERTLEGCPIRAADIPTDPCVQLVNPETGCVTFRRTTVFPVNSNTPEYMAETIFLEADGRLARSLTVYCGGKSGGVVTEDLFLSQTARYGGQTLTTRIAGQGTGMVQLDTELAWRESNGHEIFVGAGVPLQGGILYHSKTALHFWIEAHIRPMKTHTAALRVIFHDTSEAEPDLCRDAPLVPHYEVSADWENLKALCPFDPDELIQFWIASRLGTDVLI